MGAHPDGTRPGTGVHRAPVLVLVLVCVCVHDVLGGVVDGVLVGANCALVVVMLVCVHDGVLGFSGVLILTIPLLF